MNEYTHMYSIKQCANISKLWNWRAFKLNNHAFLSLSFSHSLKIEYYYYCHRNYYNCCAFINYCLMSSYLQFICIFTTYDHLKCENGYFFLADSNISVYWCCYVRPDSESCDVKMCFLRLILHQNKNWWPFFLISFLFFLPFLCFFSPPKPSFLETVMFEKC